jgi:hypothetical protein
MYYTQKFEIKGKSFAEETFQYIEIIVIHSNEKHSLV